jgi:hypothetical protein
MGSQLISVSARGDFGGTLITIPGYIISVSYIYYGPKPHQISLRNIISIRSQLRLADSYHWNPPILLRAVDPNMERNEIEIKVEEGI